MKGQDYDEPSLHQVLQCQDRQDVPKVSKISPFLKDYYTILSSPKIRTHILLEDLRDCGIQYSPDNQSSSLRLVPVHYSHNFSALSLQASLGPFSTRITVYHSPRVSYAHQLPCMSGNCGRVYAVKTPYQQTAIKCIPLNPPAQQKRPFYQERRFLSAIQQYFLCLIASALKIGPKITRLKGFDLIHYSECVEFKMERCGLLEQFAIRPHHRVTLRKAINILHELRIVHGDIKTDNVVFSNEHSQPVLIDYGLSRVLTQEKGERSWTFFSGTVQNCSQQMVELFRSGREGLADLYYNDAVAYSQTLLTDEDTSTRTPIEQIEHFFDQDAKEIIEDRLLYYLYQDRIKEAASLFKRSIDQHVVMEFMSELPTTENLRRFYHVHLSPLWSESISYMQMIKSYCLSQNHAIHFRPSQGSCQLEIRDLYKHLLNKDIDLHLLERHPQSLTNQDILQNPFHVTYSSTPTQYISDNQINHFLRQTNIIQPRELPPQERKARVTKAIQTFLIRHKSGQQASKLEFIEASLGDSLLQCWGLIEKHCWQYPMSLWKQRTLSKVFKLMVLFKEKSVVVYTEYFKTIVSLRVQTELKQRLNVSILESLMLQISNWERFPQSNQSFVSQLQALFWNGFDNYGRNTLSFRYDQFLALSLLHQRSDQSLLQSIQNEIKSLAKEQQKIYRRLARFVKALYQFRLQNYEYCRQIINEQLGPNFVANQVNAQMFLLAAVYQRLGNYPKVNQIIKFIRETIGIQELWVCCITEQQLNCSLYSKETFPPLNLWNRYKLNRNQGQVAVFCLQSFMKFRIKSPNLTNQIIKETQKVTNQLLYHQLWQLLQNSSSIGACSDLIWDIIEQVEFLKGDLGKIPNNHIPALTQIVFQIILSCHFQCQRYSEVIKIVQDRQQFPAVTLRQVKPKFLDFYLRSLHLNSSVNFQPKLRHFTDLLQHGLVQSEQSIQNFLDSIVLKLLMAQLMQKEDTIKLQVIWFKIEAIVDTHPTVGNINSLLSIVRLMFSQHLSVAFTDSLSRSIQFPKTEWQHSLTGLLHVELALKMIDDLTRRQLRSHLYRTMRYFPFLPQSIIQNAMQAIYPILLDLPLKDRYRRRLLLRARKHINYCPSFEHRQYWIHPVKFLHRHSIEEVVMCHFDPPSQIIKGEGTLLARLYTPKVFKQRYFETKTIQMSHREEQNYRLQLLRKLQFYHKNASNSSLLEIRTQSRQLLRIQVNP